MCTVSMEMYSAWGLLTTHDLAEYKQSVAKESSNNDEETEGCEECRQLSTQLPQGCTNVHSKHNRLYCAWGAAFSPPYIILSPQGEKDSGERAPCPNTLEQSVMNDTQLKVFYSLHSRCLYSMKEADSCTHKQVAGRRTLHSSPWHTQAGVRRIWLCVHYCSEFWNSTLTIFTSITLFMRFS